MSDLVSLPLCGIETRSDCFCQYPKMCIFASMTKKLPIILLNFSGVYDYESFASSQNIIHVDCRGLNGTDCYCDEEGREELRRLLAPYLPRPFILSIRAIIIILLNIGCLNCKNRFH